MKEIKRLRLWDYKFIVTEDQIVFENGPIVQVPSDYPFTAPAVRGAVFDEWTPGMTIKDAFSVDFVPERGYDSGAAGCTPKP